MNIVSHPYYRVFVVTILGLFSGLPLALTGSAMQAWLTSDGIDIKTIGFLSLIGLPYVLKFLWAPLLDRFDVPMMGRRRGWIVLSQLLLSLAIFGFAQLSYLQTPQAFVITATIIAFLSATQDVVIDAYRTDLLSENERGLGASYSTLGYRLGMILSGTIGFIWADAWNNWQEVYAVMAAIMLFGALFSLIGLPKLPDVNLSHLVHSGWYDVLGFLSIASAVIALSYVVDQTLILSGLNQWLEMLSKNQRNWFDLLILLVKIGLCIPLSMWVAQLTKFQSLTSSLSNFFDHPKALAILVFIILYKLSDTFASSLVTPFLQKGVGFSLTEIGFTYKAIGLWLSILGAIIGGVILSRIGLFKSLLYFGILQVVSNLGFWVLSIIPKGSMGGVPIPVFDWVVIALKEPMILDYLLMLVVAVEQLSGGMGTAAFVAFSMSLTKREFSATQFALLSAFAAFGRTLVGPFAGVLSEQLGWPNFYILSCFFGIPGLVMLLWIRQSLVANAK